MSFLGGDKIETLQGVCHLALLTHFGTCLSKVYAACCCIMGKSLTSACLRSPDLIWKLFGRISVSPVSVPQQLSMRQF